MSLYSLQCGQIVTSEIILQSFLVICDPRTKINLTPLLYIIAILTRLKSFIRGKEVKTYQRLAYGKKLSVKKCCLSKRHTYKGVDWNNDTTEFNFTKITFNNFFLIETKRPFYYNIYYNNNTFIVPVFAMNTAA